MACAFNCRTRGIRPGAGFLRNLAMVSASMTMSAVILGLIDQPTTSLLNRSRTTYRTHADAKADLFDYIEPFYNRKRLHSTLG